MEIFKVKPERKRICDVLLISKTILLHCQNIRSPPVGLDQVGVPSMLPAMKGDLIANIPGYCMMKSEVSPRKGSRSLGSAAENLELIFRMDFRHLNNFIAARPTQNDRAKL